MKFPKIGEEKRRHGIPPRNFERENEKCKQIAEKALKLKLEPEEVKGFTGK